MLAAGDRIDAAMEAEAVPGVAGRGRGRRRRGRIIVGLAGSICAGAGLNGERVGSFVGILVGGCLV
jgi:hypothetical protein